MQGQDGAKAVKATPATFGLTVLVQGEMRCIERQRGVATHGVRSGLFFAPHPPGRGAGTVFKSAGMNSSTLDYSVYARMLPLFQKQSRATGERTSLRLPAGSAWSTADGRLQGGAAGGRPRCRMMHLLE